jgi:hypothetical protein
MWFVKYLFFFILVLLENKKLLAQAPDPCDDCYLQWMNGEITDEELEQCLINAGCQDVPIQIHYIFYLILILITTFIYLKKRKIIKQPL